MKKLFFACCVSMAVFIPYSCSSDIPGVEEPNEHNPPDRIQRMLDDFHKSVHPEGRGINRPVVVSVSRQSYNASTYPDVQKAESREDQEGTFSVATVKFRVGSDEGFAVVCDDPRVDRMFYFTERGNIADTADIAALKDYLDQVPAVAAYHFLHPEKLQSRPQNPQITLVDNIVPFNWGQGTPYNRCATECHCQACDDPYYDGHRPIGCVTTATAQAIATMGHFTGTFYDTKNINFSTYTTARYLWNEAQRSTIAHFFHEVALNCQIKFQCNGSSGRPMATLNYLTDLGYECEYSTLPINSAKVLGNLMGGRPHIIVGYRANRVGHMWLLTGMRINNGEYDYCCNWGWDGRSNGWSVGNPYTPVDSLDTAPFPYDFEHVYVNSNP